MHQINAAIEHADDRNTSQGITIFSAKGWLTKSDASEVNILMYILLSIESRIVYQDMSGLDGIDTWEFNKNGKQLIFVLALMTRFNFSNEPWLMVDHRGVVNHRP